MRALARWGALLLLAAPLGAWALGLGDIQLRSALNQPLEADILLVSATPEELEGLRVALASRETFDLHGLERPAILSSLNFRVTRDEQGRDVIRVTSSRSVNDPFLTLLVEATWPRGRLLREYTLLVDPPVLLPPAAEPVMPAEAQRSAPSTPSGGIARPPAEPSDARPATAAQPGAEPAAAPRPASTEGTYGPVQRAETLWNIASSMAPSGVTLNQMMVALYEANPEAFDGNMNLLRQGAVLRVPGLEEVQRLNAQAATTQFQRHNEEWQARMADEPRLRLVAAGDDVRGATPLGTSSAASSGAGSAEMARLEGEVTALRSELEERERLLELRDEQLAELQARLAAAETAAEAALETPPQLALDGAPAPAPGVDVDTEIFADEVELAPADDAEAFAEVVPAAADVTAEPEPAAAAEPEAEPAQAPSPATSVAGTPAAESDLLTQVLAWLTAPMLWMGLGVTAMLGAALYFLRQRRAEETTYEDLTGQWDVLTAETDEDLDAGARAREDSERLTKQELEESILVEEPPIQASPGAAAQADDDTLSSQTAINLDQADPLAEADFHMAYGLYDQAAELVIKALQSDPSRRDLKLKLLEVYFVWGNKDAFLDAARDLREEMDGQLDGDWDKVMIMGKQLCPDQELFAGATGAAGGELDVDLAEGELPALDLELGEQTDVSDSLQIGGNADESLAFSFDEAVGDDLSGQSDADAETRWAPTRDAETPAFDDGDELDIGSMTAAGIEEALLLDDDDETGTRTASGEDVSAVTQESPTVEGPAASGASRDEADDMAFGEFGEAFGDDEPDEERWGEDATMESPTVETAGPDDPTMESPGAEWPTMETPTVETEGPEAPTVETIAIGEPGTTELPAIGQREGAEEQDASEYTAEIDLDDLGLDVDLDGLSEELGDVASAEGGDTREQPRPAQDGGAGDILSATGITEVLHTDDEGLAAALEDDLAAADEAQLEGSVETQFATAADDSFAITGTPDENEASELPGGIEQVQTLTGTEVLDEMPEAADTSLVRSLGGDGGVDLDLDDLSAALDGSQTAEQPRVSSFGGDIFGGDGETPVDLDIGFDGDDVSSGAGLDPQTMSEVGTKLDLARAYIDMGDPEGARSILEEVLEEGDPGQRQEAEGLIGSLSA